jgi:hypothetical protein
MCKCNLSFFFKIRFQKNSTVSKSAYLKSCNIFAFSFNLLFESIILIILSTLIKIITRKMIQTLSMSHKTFFCDMRFVK